MADAGVAEETREVDAGGSGGGADAPSASESAEPSVADAFADDAEDADAASSGGEDESVGDGAQDGDAADGANGDARESSGPPDPSAAPASDGPSGDGAGSDGDEQLSVRNSGSQAAPPEPNPENLRKIRAVSKRQGEDTREDASEQAAEVVRREVRRILGLDGKPDFEAESVSHVMGLARDGERVDPELEKELRAELDALGVNLDGVKLRYDSMSKEDRRQLTTFEVQQAFLRVVERVDKLATRASVSLGHRIRMFEGESQDYLKLFAGLRVLLEAHQDQVKELVVEFRDKMTEETERFEAVAAERQDALKEKVTGFQTAFDAVDGHLKSCENRARVLDQQVGSVGSTVSQTEQEAQRVMSDLQRVANSGLAVRRLALLGGVIGSAVGGFFAFVVLLLLWAVTSG